jgi:PKD repeat protein
VARFRLLSVALTAALVSGGLVIAASPAAAVQAAQATVVNPTPAGYTPDVDNGVVYSIGQVGTTVFLGGSFTTVSPHASSTTISAPYITAFTAGTGALVSTFQPTVDGEVDTITPGPAANEVYIGGSFKTVDGVKTRVALLNATTGAMVAGWKAPAFNSAVSKLVLADGQLFVGGSFTLANASVRDGLATLDPATGALTNFATDTFTGHHNYGTNCNPTHMTCANGAVGLKSLDVNPAGTELVAIGNFTSVDGQARDQVAVLNIGQTGTSLNTSWATLAYTAACFSGAFDSYIRDVQFSPDGSYFVIVATGGSGTNTDGTNSSCDTAARYEANGSGSNIRPTWIDYTGQDSFWSVAVTGTAVYAGGHERWVNNSHGFDTAGPGAVPRPGIAAFDPVNGMPLAWNPGRNPRGQGAYALLATSDGLYVGSDTEWIGNYQFHHKRIAFFPLKGGAALPSNAIGTFPGNVYLLGGTANSSAMRSVHWDGTSAPGTPASVGGGIDWSVAHGAFWVNGNIYYAESDGNLHMRTFGGRTFGSDTIIDPYDDPVWSNVDTGSGQTYRGKASTMSSEMKNVTSMFYTNGRLYYTLNGTSSMLWRWFEPNSGVIGSDEFVVNDGLSWGLTRGAFLVGSTLYFAKSTTGSLFSVPFVNGQASGTPTVADSSIDWRSAGAFVIGQSQLSNAAPTAAFTASCDTNDTSCTFNASGSSDSDGSVVSYAWNFGDGTSDTTTTPSEQHTYATSGGYQVTLTVTDNDGGTGSATHPVAAGVSPAQPVSFVADNSATANATTISTTVPGTAAAGDGLLLFESRASTSIGVTPPAGWQLVGSTARSNLTTDVYQRVATAGDPGSTVQLTFAGTVKASIIVAAYANTDPTTPVEASASSSSASSASVTAPALSGLSDGTFVVRIWGDKSSATTGWTPPGDVTKRDMVLGTGAGTVSDLLADSNGPVGSSVGADVATTNDVSGSEAGWTIALQQAPA